MRPLRKDSPGRCHRLLGWAGAMGLAIGVLAALLPGKMPAQQQGWVLLWISILNLVNLGFMARRARLEPEAAAGWWLLAATQGASLANCVVQAWYPDALPQPAWVEPLQLIWLMLLGLLHAAALMVWPWRLKASTAPGLRTLGIVIFAGSLMLLFWFVGIWAEGVGGGTIHHARLLGMAIRSVLAGGVALFLVAESPTRIRGPLGWVLASHAAWAAFLPVIGFYAKGGHGGGFPDALLALAVLPVALLGLAAPWDRPVESGSERPPGMVLELLPYLPYLLSGVVLASMGADQGSPLALPLVGFLAVTVFLLLRQWLLLREVEKANGRLEERVALRTRELEESQAVLLRTERMNTTAMLGAGIAHDLNNLLGVVVAQADGIDLDLQRGTLPQVGQVRRLQQAVHRAAHMTRRIMAYAREGDAEPVPMDLDAQLAESRDLLSLVLGKSGQLVLERPGCPVHILGLPQRVEQVLVNLVANARDALPSFGTVVIRLDRSMGPHGPTARLQVSDTGSGMTPETLARVFDPFFTTKAKGRGLGLGLASVKVLVEEVGGTIHATSEPGHGTVLTLEYPEISRSS